MNNFNHEDYLDHSGDLVARVRAAKDAAQRKMEEFGDPSEYEITIIRGRKTDVSPTTLQQADPLASENNSENTSARPTKRGRAGSERQTTLQFVTDVRGTHPRIEEK